MFEYARVSLDVLEGLLSEVRREPGVMIGRPVPGRDDDLFALDVDGTLLLLIVQDKTSVGGGLLRRYEAIRLMPTSQYDVEVDGTLVRRSYRAIGLMSTHRHLVSAFAYLTASMLSVLPQTPAPADVDDFLQKLVELLQSPVGVSESVLKGLWGELWLADRATHVGPWIKAWHSKTESLYDFCFPSGYVEVKTHEGIVPTHRFSHEQLLPRSVETEVASVLVYRDEAGESVADLIAKIAKRLPTDQRATFLDKCLRVMGTATEAADYFRYSVRNQESQNVVKAKWIPRVSVPDQAISDVRYVVDLSPALAARGTSYAHLYDTYPGHSTLAEV